MSTKTLVQSVLTCITALVALLAVSFAWFAISKEANAGLAGQVGDMETTFDLDQVMQGEDGNDQWGDANKEDGHVNQKDIMPGSAFTFRLAVRNESDTKGTISVSITGVKSYYVKGVVDEDKGKYDLSDVYESNMLFSKIQYSFSLNLLNCYWISYANSKLPQEINQNDPLPSPDDPNYVEFTDGDLNSEKEKYFHKYNVNTPEGLVPVRVDNKEKPIYFNQFKELDKNGQKEYLDETTYNLVNNIDLNSKKAGEDSPSYHNAFVIYFSIEFSSTPSVPSYINYNQNDLTSELYEGQLFGFESVTVITQKEK